MRSSTLPIVAALGLVEGLAVRSEPAETSTQLTLDAPYLAEDSWYFPQPGSEPYVNPNGTEVVKASTEEVNPFPMADCYGLPLEEATIDDMQAWMRDGLLTSRQLVHCYVGRILQLNEYVK